MNRLLSRRDACKLMVATVAGTAVTSRAAEPERKFQLNYSLASSMYGNLPLPEVVAEVRKTGAETIDLWPRVHANQREQAEEMGRDRFRELLEKNDVKLGMCTRYDLGPFKLADEIAYLKSFGGRLIVTEAKSSEGSTLKERVKNFVEKLKAPVAFAEENGITIAIENHGKSLIESPDSMRYFAEYAQSPHLGLALAPYHLPQDPHLLASLIEELGPKLAHFYAWEHGDGCFEKLPKEQEMKQMPGRGPLDFGPILKALRKIEFQGWTQVFMHPVPRGIPILPTAAEVTAAINSSRDYLDKTLAKVAG